MIDNATRVRGRPTRRPSGIVRRRRRRAASLPLFFLECDGFWKLDTRKRQVQKCLAAERDNAGRARARAFARAGQKKKERNAKKLSR